MVYKVAKSKSNKNAGKKILQKAGRNRGLTGDPSYTSGAVPEVAQRPNFIPAEELAALPVMRNKELHDKLLHHILERMRLGLIERDRRADRMTKVDVQISGYVNLDQDDAKRKRNNEAGKAPKPTKHNLPLAGAQIDEATTYLMSVYAPEMDIFEAVAPADKQQMAQALTYEINKQGQKMMYYRELAKMCVNALKYNFAGITCYWEKYMGVVFKGGAAGVVQKQNGVTFEGNVIHSVDCYNFFYDTSVIPTDLPMQGEWFAEVELRTPFFVRRLNDNKLIFGINRFIDEQFNVQGNQVFYRSPPSVRDVNVNQPGAVTDWRMVVSAGMVRESAPGIELIRFTTWIIPSDYGLSKDKDRQLWRIVVANQKYIAYAARLTDTHAMLPIAMADPLEDDLRNEQRTYAEALIPLQHFASFLLNSHQDATRKAIYGVTVFDQRLFPGLEVGRDDLIGAVIPMRGTASGIDIDKAIKIFSDAPQTDRNVEMIDKLNVIMQKILPTDMVKQVADLERATLYQAAATVQAGNRRQLKIARMISDQCLTPLKFQMVYNLFANKTQVDYIDEQSGQRIQIPMGQIVDANCEYEISTGLKGLDRLMTIQILKDVVNSLLQSQQGIQEIDIVKLLNYLMSLAGDRTDLAQFRRVTTGVPGAAGAASPVNADGTPNPTGLQTPQGQVGQANPPPNGATVPILPTGPHSGVGTPGGVTRG